MPKETERPRVAVRLDEETAADVAALARHWRTTASGVVRQAVADVARRELGDRPREHERPA